MSKNFVLFVDDSLSMQRIVESILTEIYEVKCASGAQEALTAMDQRVPDLFLLDIEMPSIDGYALARMIRERHDGKSIPIIFLSAMNTEKVIVKSYEAGGNDFITKPIIDDELKAKLAIALVSSGANDSDFLRHKNKEVHSAQTIAMNAMRNAADLGQLLEFIQGTYTCRDFDTLGNKLLEILAAYGLKAIIELRTTSKKYQYSHSGTVQPLEQSIIDKFREEHRMVDFNNRTLVNYDGVSILAKNMPLEDEHRYGQLKDVLATLAQACEPVVLSLFLKRKMDSQRLKLLTMAEMTQESLDRLVTLHKDNKYEYVKSVDGALQEAASLFHHLELSECQENAITELFAKNYRECAQRHDQTDAVDEELGLIIRALKETLQLISL